MKYFFALVIFSSGVASSDAAAPLDRIRIAQIRTPPECISNCNSAKLFLCTELRIVRLLRRKMYRRGSSVQSSLRRAQIGVDLL
jgi:hypothetical protein